jgi:YhcG PDDEXK nuclease domain
MTKALQSPAGYAALLKEIKERVRTASDAPTVGPLLCESRGKSIVEYAPRDVAKPIGLSTYRVTRQLPEPLRDEIPSIEDLQDVVEKLRGDSKGTERQAGRILVWPRRRISRGRETGVEPFFPNSGRTAQRRARLGRLTRNRTGS